MGGVGNLHAFDLVLAVHTTNMFMALVIYTDNVGATLLP